MRGTHGKMQRQEGNKSGFHNFDGFSKRLTTIYAKKTTAGMLKKRSNTASFPLRLPTLHSQKPKSSCTPAVDPALRPTPSSFRPALNTTLGAPSEHPRSTLGAPSEHPRSTLGAPSARPSRSPLPDPARFPQFASKRQTDLPPLPRQTSKRRSAPSALSPTQCSHWGAHPVR